MSGAVARWVSMRIRRFTDPNDTEALNALMHDRWFPVSRISEDEGELVIPFASLYVKRAREAMFDSTLRIGHVQSWRIQDTEEIEIYNFDRLTFNEALGCVRLDGSIPVTVEAWVSAYAV